jgi:hypothetical protein
MLALPAGHAAAQVVVLHRVTDFHLGLNANRRLKIRMRQIADGAKGLVAGQAEAQAEKEMDAAAVAQAAEGEEAEAVVLDDAAEVMGAAEAVEAVEGAGDEGEAWKKALTDAKAEAVAMVDDASAVPAIGSVAEAEDVVAVAAAMGDALAAAATLGEADATAGAAVAAAGVAGAAAVEGSVKPTSVEATVATTPTAISILDGSSGCGRVHYEQTVSNDGGGGEDDIARLLENTGLVLDPSGVIWPRPPDASHVFEHWGAGGNTGISGQVTGHEREVGVVTPGL